MQRSIKTKQKLNLRGKCHFNFQLYSIHKYVMQTQEQPDVAGQVFNQNEEESHEKRIKAKWSRSCKFIKKLEILHIFIIDASATNTENYAHIEICHNFCLRWALFVSGLDRPQKASISYGNASIIIGYGLFVLHDWYSIACLFLG